MPEKHRNEKTKVSLWEKINILISRISFPPDSEEMSIREAAWRAKMGHEMALAWIEELKKGGQSSRSLRRAIKKVKKRWRVERRWELDFTNDEFVKETLEKTLGQKLEGVVYCNTGAIYYHKGMYDEAVILFKKAIEINPEDVDAHFNLGLAYGNKGLYNEAIVSCKKAIDIDPRCAAAHYSLAVAYYAAAKYELAIEHCDRAIELGYGATSEFLELLKPYRGNPSSSEP